MLQKCCNQKNTQWTYWTQWTFKPLKNAKIRTKTHEIDVLDPLDDETLQSHSSVFSVWSSICFWRSDSRILTFLPTFSRESVFVTQDNKLTNSQKQLFRTACEANPDCLSNLIFRSDFKDTAEIYFYFERIGKTEGINSLRLSSMETPSEFWKHI